MKHYLFVILWTIILWNPLITHRLGTGRLFNLCLMAAALIVSLLLVHFCKGQWRTISCILLVIATAVLYVCILYQRGYTDKYMPQTMARIYNKKLPEGCKLDMFIVEGKETELVSLGVRKTVIVNYKGLRIPFYLSTGLGKKEKVPKGQWYPFFGVDKNGWLNKAVQEVIRNYYYNDFLKEIAFSLDDAIGDIRDTGRGVWINRRDPRAFEPIRKQINRDVRGDKPYLGPDGEYHDISEAKAGDIPLFYTRIKGVLHKLDSLHQQSSAAQ